MAAGAKSKVGPSSSSGGSPRIRGSGLPADGSACWAGCKLRAPNRAASWSPPFRPRARARPSPSGAVPRSVSRFPLLLPRASLEEIRQVIGVLLLDRENLLEHVLRGGIVVADVERYLAIAVDRDALGHQVLADHLLDRLAETIFRVAALRERLGIEVGLAAELDDALGELVGMPVLLVGVLEE